MKVLFLLPLFFSHVAWANPLFSVKDRLRLHLWVYGLEEKAPLKPRLGGQTRTLPEELERALKKI